MRLAPAILVLGAMLPACIFHAGDTCEGDVCLPNGSPIARIRGVDTNGNLKVGARTQVLLSAADSADPDGDMLAYLWTVSGTCTANVTGVLNGVELMLTNLAPASDCSVALKVSDGVNDSSAAAILLVRDVGAHVSTAAPCVATFNESSDQPQGTPTTPFCALRDALAVAADYQLAEVSVAGDGLHKISAPLTIDRSVTIRGGYVRNSGPWTATSGRSEIQLLASSVTTSDTTLRIAAAAENDVVTLKNVSVFRGAPCIHLCAIVDVVATNLVLTDVDLGVSQNNTPIVRQGSANEAYFSLRVTGTGDLDKPRHLSASKLTIQGASSGKASLGISLTDAVDAVINSSTITELAHTVTGVALLRAGSVRIEKSVINAKGDALTADAARAEDSIAIGVIDGNSDTLAPGSCLASGGGVCGSSVHLTVSDTNITVSKVRLGIGIGAFGTRTLEFAPGLQPSVITVAARQAYGLATLATGQPDADVAGVVGGQVNITATATANAGLPVPFAYGWSDGYETGEIPVVGLGSYRPSLDDAHINVSAGSQDVVDVGGVVWRDTTQAALIRGNVSVASTGSPPTDGWTVTRAVGVRLMRAHGATLDGTLVQMGQLEASWISGALLDGQMNAGNDDLGRDASGNTYASTSIVVSGTTFNGTLSVHHLDEIPLRACVGLFGTNAVLIDDSTIACSLGASESESDPTMGGVVLLQTRDVVLSRSRVTISSSGPVALARLVGVQDGSRLSNLLGSSGLHITGNIIDIEVTSSIAIGVRVAGSFDPAVAALALSIPNTNPGPFTPSGSLIDDNVVHIGGADASLGTLVTSSSTTIAFNSVRVDDCLSNCGSAFAVGFYLLQVDHNAPVMLLGNGFSVPGPSHGSGGDGAAAIVEDQASAHLREVSAVKDNLYGYELIAGNPSFYIEVSTGDTTPVSPQIGSGVDETMLANSPYTVAIGNLNMAPWYCTDGIHGDPAGPQVALASHVDSTPFGGTTLTDIDAERVVIPGGDVGADAIAGACR